MAILASDLMTATVFSLTPEMNLVEMDTLLVKRGVSGAPVIERNRLVGVASQADIIRSLWQQNHEAYQHGGYYSSPFPIPISALEYASRNANELGNQLVERRVRDIMTSDPLVAFPEDSLADIAQRMVDDQVHRLPVVNRGDSRLLGIISTLDVVHAITKYGLIEPS